MLDGIDKTNIQSRIVLLLQPVEDSDLENPSWNQLSEVMLAGLIKLGVMLASCLLWQGVSAGAGECDSVNFSIIR
jgi:hypothetical protein